MSKKNDIHTLFSLLDKKPDGVYQEILLDEKIKESKERWPIFGLSDVPNQNFDQDDNQPKHHINHSISNPKIFEKEESSTDLKKLFNKLEKKEEKSFHTEKSIFDKLVRK